MRQGVGLQIRKEAMFLAQVSRLYIGGKFFYRKDAVERMELPPEKIGKMTSKVCELAFSTMDVEQNNGSGPVRMVGTDDFYREPVLYKLVRFISRKEDCVRRIQVTADLIRNASEKVADSLKEYEMPSRLKAGVAAIGVGVPLAIAGTALGVPAMSGIGALAILAGCFAVGSSMHAFSRRIMGDMLQTVIQAVSQEGLGGHDKL